MADIQFRMNSQAFDLFRTASFDNENTIANLDGKNAVKSGGVLSKNIFRAWGRSVNEKKANNEVRTELLRMLGQAFGVAGMTGSDGQVRFSVAFMDKLERILGKGVFKKGDFGVAGANGTVTSGKPLTQRRITAILTKAAMVGATALDKSSISVYETKLDAIAKKIKLDAYEAKLKALDKLDPDAKFEAKAQLMNQFPVQAHFHSVKTALAFYKNELPTFLRKNPDFDPDAQKDEDDDNLPDFLKDDMSKAANAQYQLYDADKGHHVKYDTLKVVQDYLNSHCGLYFHVENATTLSSFANMKDPVKDMKDYVGNAIAIFVQTSINGYMSADKAGKANDFVRAASNACVEGKGGELQDFLVKNNLVPQVEGEEIVSAAEILDAADSGHDENTTLDQCIYKELEKIAADAKKAGKSTDGWTWKDVADTVKKALVDKKRPIMVPGPAGFVNLTEGDKEVTRKVTAEDVDKIGQTCMDILAIF